MSDGLYSVKLPVRELTSCERDVLDDLFPHLGRCVSDLLDKEALLDAIVGPDENNAVTENEVEAEKGKYRKTKAALIKEASDKYNANEVRASQMAAAAELDDSNYSM